MKRGGEHKGGGGGEHDGHFHVWGEGSFPFPPESGGGADMAACEGGERDGWMAGWREGGRDGRLEEERRGGGREGGLGSLSGDDPIAPKAPLQLQVLQLLPQLLSLLLLLLLTLAV